MIRRDLDSAVRINSDQGSLPFTAEDSVYVTAIVMALTSSLPAGPSRSQSDRHRVGPWAGQ